MRDGVNVPRAGISRSSSPTTYGGDQRPRLTELGKRIYARRKETVKRSFANAKKLHGHRYARFRGLSKIQAQRLLSAACQNMKKMALLLARKAAALFAQFVSRGLFARLIQWAYRFASQFGESFRIQPLLA